MIKKTYFADKTYQECDPDEVQDPQDMIGRDTQFLNNHDYYGPIAFNTNDTNCVKIKRSKSEEYLELNHANLDVTIHDKGSVNNTEEKSEKSNDFLYSVRDLLGANQGQMVRTNQSSFATF